MIKPQVLVFDIRTINRNASQIANPFKRFRDDLDIVVSIIGDIIGTFL